MSGVTDEDHPREHASVIATPEIAAAVPSVSVNDLSPAEVFPGHEPATVPLPFYNRYGHPDTFDVFHMTMVASNDSDDRLRFGCLSCKHIDWEKCEVKRLRELEEVCLSHCNKTTLLFPLSERV
ncbi:unnamed protein product [Soboliphyme baturini]|uniref:Uncharacterized protein n=1 Tax=Soboliphyme baturini TaxID=241478 RepID=A0A183IX19_9BILA|nr:unnamed protein product [Soboliphyme baturini]